MIVYNKKKLDQELTLSMKKGESITLSVSEDDSKSRITLSIDEARALRDFLKRAIKTSDEASISPDSEEEEPKTEFYDYEEEKKEDEFKLFKKEGVEGSEKQKTEFYY